MHGRGVRLDHRDDINWLSDRLSPVLGAKSERAAGLGFGHQHPIQSDIYHSNTGRQILNEAGHAALEAVMAVDVKRDRNFLSRLDGNLSGFRGHDDIGRRGDGRKLQRLVQVAV